MALSMGRTCVPLSMVFAFLGVLYKEVMSVCLSVHPLNRWIDVFNVRCGRLSLKVFDNSDSWSKQQFYIPGEISCTS